MQQHANGKAVVMVADRLTRHYRVRRGMVGTSVVKALNGVSFMLERGKTLAVVGESGCGKSTLARQLTMIEPPTSGSLQIGGHDAGLADRNTWRKLRQRVQLVFQNPLASLNPRKTIGQTLTAAMSASGISSASERAARLAQIMSQVGLHMDCAGLYPHMLSGGQRQRVAIGRALVAEPDIIVADEPVSALDVSIQAQILNLFMDLQQQVGVSYVFISHNLTVVEHIADQVMVMYLGSVIEFGDKSRIFSAPSHPYTRALLAATPKLEPAARRQKIELQGELPSPINPPSGCAFHTRCPHATQECAESMPELRKYDARLVACHRAGETGMN